MPDHHTRRSCYDRAEQILISKTIRIKQPLTIRGLNARLVNGLGKTLILRVMYEGFSIKGFELDGNAATIEQKMHAQQIRVERGQFDNSSKDGVEINTVADGRDIVGGIVRNVVSVGVVRDVASICRNSARCMFSLFWYNIGSVVTVTSDPSDGRAEIVLAGQPYVAICVRRVEVSGSF
jgi:hypothetical protein